MSLPKSKPRPKPGDLQARLRSAYPDARCALDHADPFQLVVATILSAQCTDARVNLTTPALFARFPDAASLAGARLEELEGLIRSTGFYHNKARNLIGLGQALMARHGGVVPSDPAALGALPGVGQKTANVVLANAFGVPALAVDTHIFRVARRLGLSRATTPEKVEADLCRRFPREDWIELHHQLIFHGRRVCDARRPDCGACTLLDLCPTGLGKAKDPHLGVKLQASVPGLPASAISPPTSSASGSLRIVSLVPSVTELLVQWGLAAQLVGRTRYCIEPRWIRNSVPTVGGTKDPDLRRIRDLAPDLVILERDENPKEVAEALTALGLPWLALEIRSVKDCAAALRQLGARLGVPEAAELRATALETALKGRRRKGPRTLALVWKEPWMSAGPDTYIGDLLRQGNLTPIGPDRYPVLTEEDLQDLAPRLILLPSEPYRFNRRHQTELQKRFPSAEVRLVDGRALTWYLSRTEAGLELARSL
ncbi:MAG: endonuclease III [Geothrix sp.]|uniref:endonuclease III n=1 Tax=Geothrix sp. TaxID=1962974 RepID=UPI0017D9B717|nr:endonuclease III [Geothrix sp.]NWJ40911.1 endonuclease III [Geothrix sp.]WIL21089.1 MAG: endonuclease III [Geothrix sp.]